MYLARSSVHSAGPLRLIRDNFQTRSCINRPATNSSTISPNVISANFSRSPEKLIWSHKTEIRQKLFSRSTKLRWRWQINFPQSPYNNSSIAALPATMDKTTRVRPRWCEMLELLLCAVSVSTSVREQFLAWNVKYDVPRLFCRTLLCSDSSLQLCKWVRKLELGVRRQWNVQTSKA